MEGFDALRRDLESVQQAAAALEGTIATLKVDPNNPQEAIRQMEAVVDSKVAPYGQSELVLKIAEEAKEHYRNQILLLAVEKR